MKQATLLMLALLQSPSYAQSCLNSVISGKSVKVITGIGITYEEARQDLFNKLPQLGVLESIDLKTTKISTQNTYNESSILSKSIKASFEHFNIQNCKLPDGRYASSAAFPLEGISYLPKGELSEIFDEPIFKKEFVTFKYANRVCGKDIYTVLISLNTEYSVSGGRTIFDDNVKGVHRVVVCGEFKLKTRWFNDGWTSEARDIFANRYNMIYLGSYRQKEIRDLSKEMGLEMIKNAIGTE